MGISVILGGLEMNRACVSCYIVSVLLPLLRLSPRYRDGPAPLIFWYRPIDPGPVCRRFHHTGTSPARALSDLGSRPQATAALFEPLTGPSSPSLEFRQGFRGPKRQCLEGGDVQQPLSSLQQRVLRTLQSRTAR